MIGELSRWADAHQYDAEPQPTATEHEGVQPNVILQTMNADPLGDMAMFTGIYEGKVFRDRSEVTDDMRRKVLEDVQKTHLKAPLEVIKLHFLLEGVDRAFTHQHVRQRTAVYGQESMRFAVMGDLMDATTLPPSLAGTQRTQEEDWAFMPQPGAEANRRQWDAAIEHIDRAYHYLVENGVPAEEARGLLPHATATRIHYVTDLRNLPDHAGNRLCTQAQFHWRLVFAGVVDAIRNYTPDFSWMANGTLWHTPNEIARVRQAWEDMNRWQFEAIADSGLFRPVCYQLGHCPMQASFDRSCSIRERVEIRAKHGGHDSSKWHEPFTYLEEKVAGTEVLHNEGLLGGSEVLAERKVSPGISPAEWLADPAAARKATS